MSPQSVHVRNEEIDRWDHPVDDLYLHDWIPHIVSLAMFVTMKSTLEWMCIVPITTKVFANCLLSTLNNRLTNLDDHLGPTSIEMAPMFGGSNAPGTVTTSTVRGADQAPVVNTASSLPTVGSS
ncbi:hypothetical protein EYR40_002812 [Pleurotus pulmonarius]|nr:hypothetical protein EYR40_002812 [Pleurotus pulmonarius]KAF4582338.1 hypothetical protein EYR38_002456 [Pleurotus pulmonarius]